MQKVRLTLSCQPLPPRAKDMRVSFFILTLFKGLRSGFPFWALDRLKQVSEKNQFSELDHFWAQLHSPISKVSYVDLCQAQ